MNGSWARSSRASAQLVRPNMRLKLAGAIVPGESEGLYAGAHELKAGAP
jgi:hypothetical protein